MFFSFVRSMIRQIALLALGVATLVPVALVSPAVAADPLVHPLVSDWQFLSSGPTPPSQTACNNAQPFSRRCFNPTAMHNSYNYATLLAAGNKGQGKTIAIVDSFGSSTIRNDLGVFDTTSPPAIPSPSLTRETDARFTPASSNSTVSPNRPPLGMAWSTCGISPAVSR